MSTGSTPVVRAALGRMTYPAELRSVRLARRFVEGTVETAGLGALADDAGLLVSELATNAVLHARTAFDVVVHGTDGGVRVHVHDRGDALPVLTAPSATAMSGRGLALVRTLAARWAVEATPPGGKSVWFELAPTARALDADLSVEELLATWADGPADGADDVAADSPAGALEEDEVLIPDLPAGELLVAKEHMDDLLRELQLVLLGGREGGGPSGGWAPTEAEVAVARRLDASARAFDAVRRQVREQVSRSVAAGEERVTLRLRLPPGTRARAADYRAAVEAAERLAGRGGLLTRADALGRHGAVRRAYLDQIVTAAGP